MTQLTQVTIYCDGSCLKNPGPGGWAALLIFNQQQKLISGQKADTTNNRMELLAAIMGLKALKRKCKVDLICDSKYVVQGMSEWIFGWQKNNWKTSQKKAVMNADLWQELLLLNAKHDVRYIWTKGHAGNPLNDLVDTEARKQAELLKHSTP